MGIGSLLTRKESNPQIQAIIAKDYRKKQQSLILYSNDRWEQVLGFCGWQQLKSLELYSKRISDDKLKVLLAMDWLRLENFKLCNNTDLTVEGVRTIAQANLPSLCTLSLSENSIDNEGLSILLDSKLPKLALLNVDHNCINAEGMRLLKGREIRLQLLNLSWNNIGACGLKLLIKSVMPYLQILSLTSCKLGNEGFIHLAKSAYPVLQQLKIIHNDAGLDGHQMLSTLNRLKLTKITIGDHPKWTHTFFASDPIVILSLIPLTTLNADMRVISRAQNWNINQHIGRISFRTHK